MPTEAATPRRHRTPDLLIEQLAAGLRPVRRRSIARDAAFLAAVGGAELLAFLIAVGPRPDLQHALMQPSWWWKLLGMGVVSGLGVAAALVSLDPSRSPRWGVRALAAALTACILAGWALDASAAGLGPLAGRLDWRHGVDCVWKMAALSLPVAVALGALLRRGAPADRSGTAWAAAAGTAAWGAFVFVFACPSDDPLYIAVWYAVGLATVGLAARIIFSRLIRW